MERGTYASLDYAKAAMELNDTVDDARIVSLLEYASRRIDGDTGRHFYGVQAAKLFTPRAHDSIIVPDLISVATLKTDDGYRTYSTTWAETDYDLDPANSWPKWRISTAPSGANSFLSVSRGVQITGLWGYADSETPYTASGATATVNDAVGSTITVSAATAFSVGQTILVESEQMYITAVGASLSVERGVNGTAAAAHAAKAANIWRYPDQIREACRILAARVNAMPTLGVVGSSDLGTVESVARFDPEYLFAIAPFRLARVL